MDLGREILHKQFQDTWSVCRSGKRITPQELDRLLGPSSLNVTLARELLIPLGGEVVNVMEPESVSHRKQVMSTSYALAPGQFILGVTQEAVDCTAPLFDPRLPPPERVAEDIVKLYRSTDILHVYPSYEGRRTLASLGLMTQLNPGSGCYGYSNTWTIQLFNCSQNIITLYPGMLIGQLVFRQVVGAVQYSGPYGEVQPGPTAPLLGPERG